MFLSSNIKFFFLLPVLALVSCQTDVPQPADHADPVAVAPAKPRGRQPLFPEPVTAVRLVADGQSLSFINYHDGSYFADDGTIYSPLISIIWQGAKDTDLVPWSGEPQVISPRAVYQLEGRTAAGEIISFRLLQAENGLVYLPGAAGGQVVVSVTDIGDWQDLARPDNRYIDKRLWPVELSRISQLEVVEEKSGHRFSWAVNQPIPQNLPVKNILYLLAKIGGEQLATTGVTPLFSLTIQENKQRQFAGRLGLADGHFYGQTVSGRQAGQWVLLPDSLAVRLAHYLSSLFSGVADERK